jgi:hypothetical protein
MFAVNRNLFLDNDDVYSIKTWNSYKLHLPSTHLKQNIKKQYIMLEFGSSTTCQLPQRIQLMKPSVQKNFKEVSY